MVQTGKNVIDAAAASSVVVTGWTTEVLPFLSVFLPCIWFIIRIWESDTIRGLTKRDMLDKKEDE